MSIISYYTKVHLSKCNGSWVASTKQTMNFNIQTAVMFVLFVFEKNCLIKSFSSFEDLSVHKISWSHVDWCKFCIHRRSLNVRHFGMLEDTGLISMASRSSSMALNFIKIYQLVQKLLGGTHRRTGRQTGDLISFTFLQKESKLKQFLFHVMQNCDRPRNIRIDELTALRTWELKTGFNLEMLDVRTVRQHLAIECVWTIGLPGSIRSYVLAHWACACLSCLHSNSICLSNGNIQH
jgi:hypothetical protein